MKVLGSNLNRADCRGKMSKLEKLPEKKQIIYSMCGSDTHIGIRAGAIEFVCCAKTPDVISERKLGHFWKYPCAMEAMVYRLIQRMTNLKMIVIIITLRITKK